MKKEDLSKKYAEKVVRESPNNLYKGYHLHRQMELTRFDGYDIQQAFEDGFDAGFNGWKEAKGYINDNFQWSEKKTRKRTRHVYGDAYDLGHADGKSVSLNRQIGVKEQEFNFK